MAFSDANASLLSMLGEAMNDQNEQINVCLEALEKDPNDKESFERLVGILQRFFHQGDNQLHERGFAFKNAIAHTFKTGVNHQVFV